MPAGLLSSKTDATIEIWATVHEFRNWSRIIDCGRDNLNNLFLSWSRFNILNSDRFEYRTNVATFATVDDALGPYTPGVLHHIVVTIDDDGAEGFPRLALNRDGQFRGSQTMPFRLAELADERCMLGRSHYVGFDEVAAASWSEVRFYDRALLAEEISARFNKGPMPFIPPN